MKINTYTFASLIFAGALVSTSAALAAPTAEQKCFAKQLKALSKLCSAQLGCWAEVTSTGVPDSCLVAGAEATALTKIEKAEDALTCIVEGVPAFDDATGLAAVTASDIHDLLDPAGMGDDCGAAKLKALAKFCSSALKCRAKDHLTGGLKPFDDCITKPVDKVLNAFLKAESGGTCVATSDLLPLAATIVGSSQNSARIYRGSCAGNWSGSYSGIVTPFTIGGTIDVVVADDGSFTGTAHEALVLPRDIPGSGTVDGTGNVSGSFDTTIVVTGVLDCPAGTGSGTLGGIVTAGTWNLMRVP